VKYFFPIINQFGDTGKANKLYLNRGCKLEAGWSDFFGGYLELWSQRLWQKFLKSAWEFPRLPPRPYRYIPYKDRPCCAPSMTAEKKLLKPIHFFYILQDLLRETSDRCSTTAIAQHEDFWFHFSLSQLCIFVSTYLKRGDTFANPHFFLGRWLKHGSLKTSLLSS